MNRCTLEHLTFTR